MEFFFAGSSGIGSLFLSFVSQRTLPAGSSGIGSLFLSFVWEVLFPGRCCRVDGGALAEGTEVEVELEDCGVQVPVAIRLKNGVVLELGQVPQNGVGVRVNQDQAELAGECCVDSAMGSDNLPGADLVVQFEDEVCGGGVEHELITDRKSTRLNSSHLGISYA